MRLDPTLHAAAYPRRRASMTAPDAIAMDELQVRNTPR